MKKDPLPMYRARLLADGVEEKPPRGD